MHESPHDSSPDSELGPINGVINLLLAYELATDYNFKLK